MQQKIQEPVGDWKPIAGGIITASIKELLETRHLYQSVTLNVSPLERFSKDSLQWSQNSELTPLQLAEMVLGTFDWIADDNADMRRMVFPNGGPDQLSIHFQIDSVLVFCPKCDQKMPFGLLRARELIKHLHSSRREIETGSEQVFALTFQCQGCRGIPESFLIGRRERKLTLAGRSPMEVIEIPKFIPKEQRIFYRDAAVAYNSGQTLAALFLLRTFTEQHARWKTKSTSRDAKDVMEAYMALLPQDFKDRFPSLKNVYGDLSEAIHQANADSKLFESSRTAIDTHFEALKLFLKT